MHRATRFASRRPCGQLPPNVRSGFKRGDSRDVRLWRSVFQILVEKWPENFLAEVQSGVAAELDRAQRTAVVDLLAVVPGTHHEEYLVIARIFGLQRFVNRGRAVN